VKARVTGIAAIQGLVPARAVVGAARSCTSVVSRCLSGGYSMMASTLPPFAAASGTAIDRVGTAAIVCGRFVRLPQVGDDHAGRCRG